MGDSGQNERLREGRKEGQRRRQRGRDRADKGERKIVI